MQLLAVVLLALALLGPANTAQEAELLAPGADLKTAIPHGIMLLKGEKYVEFLKTYAMTTELNQAIEDRGVTIEEFAKVFGERSAKRLLKVLQTIQDQQPEYNADRSEATFSIPRELNLPQDRIIWVNVDGLWQIRN